MASGREITIKKLVMIIKKQMNYNGEIIWDKSMPMGSDRRNVSIGLARTKINYEPKFSLEDGIKKLSNHI